MDCPTCSEPMDPGTLGLGKRALDEVFAPFAASGRLVFDPEDGPAFTPLDSGGRARAFHCASCRVVVFAATA